MQAVTMIATIAVCLALAASGSAKLADDWVTEARAVEGAFSESEAVRITMNDDCEPTITMGGSPLPGSIQLRHAHGHIIEICSTGGAHYFEAPEFFQNAAVRKFESATGYVKGVGFSACEAFQDGCCAMYVVPVVPGTYAATDSKCNDTQIASLRVPPGSTATVEQGISDEFRTPEQLGGGFLGADSSDWPGWNTATRIEVALVEEVECVEQATATPAGRRLAQTAALTEGDGEDVEASHSLRFVYSMGHTNVETDLIVEQSEALGEGVGGSGTAPGGAVEGGEGGAVEGGAVEGGAVEGGAPGAVEGGEGGAVEGGTVEGGAPGAVEGGEGGAVEGGAVEGGAPGAVEGGEGGAVEGGAGGAVEGGEGGAVEGGAGGAVEGGEGGAVEGGEGAAPARRMLSKRAVPNVLESDPMDIYLGGEALGDTSARSLHSALRREPARVLAQEGGEGGVEGGEGGAAEGQGALPATVTVVDAGQHPIEMVVGQGYVIAFRLIRATSNQYFSAPEFFATAVTRKLQDVEMEVKFAAYPTEVEMFGDGGYMEMYVVPAVAGEYPLTSGSVASDRLNGAMLRVVESVDQLSDPSSIATVDVSGTCAPGTESREVIAPAGVDSAPAASGAAAPGEAAETSAAAVAMLGAASAAAIAAVAMVVML